MIITYYVHGTSKDNEEKISSGWSNTELSEKGIKQTEEAASRLVNVNYDLILCSDLLRAKQTADILFPNTKKLFDCRLRECNYGIFNGTEYKNVEYKDHILNQFPEGECLIDVQTRVIEVLTEIKSKYLNKSIAIIGHHATQLAIEVYSKKISWIEAIENDWRKVGDWQLGWKYNI